MEPLGVTPDEAKKMIGCGTTTLYELLKTGDLKSYRIGGSGRGRGRRITTASIRAFVKRGVEADREARFGEDFGDDFGKYLEQRAE